MKRLIWIAVAVVLVAGGGWAATATPAPRYRVATVSVGDVNQTVTVTGTVDHVNRADVAFGTDGTIASLGVSPGDAVTAGQELGTLDTAALEAAVTQASAAVTAAEAALAEDEAAQEEAAGASDELASAQQEVKAAQSAAMRALTAASSAFEAQGTACTDPSSAACTAAVTATRTAQEAVQQAQSLVQQAIDKLAGMAPAQPPANEIADGQASVEEASAKLVEAQQALAGATLVAPITGTVGAVSATEGAAVTAGTPVVTVIGEGAAEVSATVPVEQLEKLAVGQEATVTPVGTTAAVPGTVTSVGTLPSPAAETVVYPVTITVSSPPAAMAAGSTSTATITVATASEVLTVPTSAVRRGMVTVLSGDQTTPTPVTVGAVGTTRTEIKEGLSEGASVVLADLDTPVPTNDQQQSEPGGFVGGGGPVRMMRPNR